MSDKKHYVYALYEKGNPRIRYIGVTINPKRRLNAHTNDTQYDSNEYKRRWVEKISKNVAMRIIKSGLSENDAYDLEKRLIALARTKRDDLINIHDGGKQPFRTSDNNKWPWGNKRTPISLVLFNTVRTAKQLDSDVLMSKYLEAKSSYGKLNYEQKLIANLLMIERNPFYATWNGQIQIGESMYPSNPVHQGE